MNIDWNAVMASLIREAGERSAAAAKCARDSDIAASDRELVIGGLLFSFAKALFAGLHSDEEDIRLLFGKGVYKEENPK